ncbi:MAG: 2,6-dihydroxypyridine 3-hydroxylase [Burkholderiales bacterium]
MAMPCVAVAGGSLGGLTAALVLRDAGCQVEVYERSHAPLSGYGAGIVVQPELSRYFLERTDLTLERISVPSDSIKYYDAARGTLIGKVDAAWRYTSYNALYRGLLRAYGRERYHLGETLSAIEQDEKEVRLRFASGREARCGLAVCADGSFSTARQLLLDVDPRYAGYVTWRGLAPQGTLSPDAWRFFDGHFTYGLLPDSHLIAYPIPTVTDEVHVDGRSINFQWYWNVAEGAPLDALMTDRHGARRPVSVHADDVQSPWLEELRRRARERIALEPFVELIERAPQPFVTIIADTDVPRMAIGRACLIGDAAVTGRPHAAAGAAKAAANGWALAEALVAANGDVADALRRWEPQQLRQGRAMLAKVRRMGELLQSGGPFAPGDPANRFGLPPAD